MTKDKKEVIKYKESKITKKEILDFLMPAVSGKNISKTEQEIALRIALENNLNPAKRDVHFIPYGGKISVVTGYNVYLKRAERSGKLDGWKVYTEGHRKDNTLKAIVEIKRKDWSDVFRHEVYFVEYAQNNNMWKTKPLTMLKKVAIAQAFRLAFPEDVGGLPYTAEEQWEEKVLEEAVKKENNITKAEEADFEEIPNDDRSVENEENPDERDRMRKMFYTLLTDLAKLEGLDNEAMKEKVLVGYCNYKGIPPTAHTSMLSIEQLKEVCEMMHKKLGGNK